MTQEKKIKDQDEKLKFTVEIEVRDQHLGSLKDIEMVTAEKMKEEIIRGIDEDYEQKRNYYNRRNET